MLGGPLLWIPTPYVAGYYSKSWSPVLTHLLPRIKKFNTNFSYPCKLKCCPSLKMAFLHAMHISMQYRMSKPMRQIWKKTSWRASDLGWLLSLDVISLLLKHFPKMGIEFRDAGYILSAKNTRLLRQNMICNLSLGFTSLSDASGQKFGIGFLDVTSSDISFLQICLESGWHHKDWGRKG